MTHSLSEFIYAPQVHLDHWLKRWWGAWRVLTETALALRPPAINELHDILADKGLVLMGRNGVIYLAWMPNGILILTAAGKMTPVPINLGETTLDYNKRVATMLAAHPLCWGSGS